MIILLTYGSISVELPQCCAQVGSFHARASSEVQSLFSVLDSAASAGAGVAFSPFSCGLRLGWGENYVVNTIILPGIVLVFTVPIVILWYKFVPPVKLLGCRRPVSSVGSAHWLVRRTFTRIALFVMFISAPRARNP